MGKHGGEGKKPKLKRFNNVCTQVCPKEKWIPEYVTSQRRWRTAAAGSTSFILITEHSLEAAGVNPAELARPKDKNEDSPSVPFRTMPWWTPTMQPCVCNVLRFPAAP
ncbi:hypothetical protein CEXT_688071 [Caerostris extrusa]|uniref:Uncharacterized protein n=1 Tax=Caerostris extrusa TaxID=172846 RepID=A0AAV4QP98_CAEEX|nr:hypothetical protein CEXT_688071 [Caerostris extrusa]